MFSQYIAGNGSTINVQFKKTSCTAECIVEKLYEFLYS